MTYERNISLPSMRQWLGDPISDSLETKEDAAAADQSWRCEQHSDVAALLAEFATIRAKQIALLPLFTATQWDERRDAIWGAMTLRWVCAKSY